MESVLNRYYDPSTDSFISVDPMVQETDQPYVFVNDDPLNNDDPLGLYASSGNGQSAFVTTTSGKTKTTTIVVTSGNKPVRTSISTTPVTVPLGFGVVATVSASATITGTAISSTPTLNVDSDGSVGVTANGVTGNVEGSGGNVVTALSAGIVSGSSQSFSIGGDQVQANISVALSYSGPNGPSSGLATGARVGFGGGFVVAGIGLLFRAFGGCFLNPASCGVG